MTEGRKLKSDIKGAGSDPRSPNSLQIGAAGVLLIQYLLLKEGIESAPMTTDVGIDLVVYAPARRRPLTVQVKTCLRPKPAGGGNGALHLDWRLRTNSPADLVGLVNLADDEAWLFRHSEFAEKAQQNASGKFHFYFYTDGKPRKHAKEAYERYRIGKRGLKLFGSI